MRGRVVIAWVALWSMGALHAQTAKPNFTGMWVLNTAKSQLTIPDPPVTSTFIFIHREPNWHMERTHFFRHDKPNTVQLNEVIGGEPITTTDGDDVTRTRMYWEGNKVVLDQQIIGPDNTHGSNHVIYSLSADGNGLTAVEHEEYPDGKITNRWAFDRLPLPAMTFTYPGRGLSDTAVAKLKRILERDHGDCDPKGSKIELEYALINLGKLGPAVIVRSKRGCDCGATGNCVIYLYQRHGDAFHELPFRNDASPWGSSYGFVMSPFGTVFLVISSHMSAELGGLAFYEYFGGMFTGLGGACSKNNPSDPAKIVLQDCGQP